jgi:hypothetical protein
LYTRPISRTGPVKKITTGQGNLTKKARSALQPNADEIESNKRAFYPIPKLIQ